MFLRKLKKFLLVLFLIIFKCVKKECFCLYILKLTEKWLSQKIANLSYWGVLLDTKFSNHVVFRDKRKDWSSQLIRWAFIPFCIKLVGIASLVHLGQIILSLYLLKFKIMSFMAWRLVLPTCNLILSTGAPMPILLSNLIASFFVIILSKWLSSKFFKLKIRSFLTEGDFVGKELDCVIIPPLKVVLAKTWFIELIDDRININK